MYFVDRRKKNLRKQVTEFSKAVGELDKSVEVMEKATPVKFIRRIKGKRGYKYVYKETSDANGLPKGKVEPSTPKVEEKVAAGDNYGGTKAGSKERTARIMAEQYYKAGRENNAERQSRLRKDIDKLISDGVDKKVVWYKGTP